MTVSDGFFLYLLVMAGVTYLVRLLPMIFVRKKITNRFIRSFLYYVPYAVLAAMTFPAIIFETGHLASGIAALVVCVALGFMRRGLITVASGGALTVLVCELIIAFVI